jgi:hypothetical protein
VDSVYEDTTFCDLTIRCQNRSLRVHRVVICSQCSFFQRACTNGFRMSSASPFRSLPKLTRSQESHTGVIELPEDEPKIFEHIIEFSYLGSYGESRFVGLLEHAQVFSFATKYDHPTLAQEAIEHYADLAYVTFPQRNLGGDFGEFLETIPYVYQSTAGPIRGLKNAVVMKMIQGLWDQPPLEEYYDEWREICRDVPEFAARFFTVTGDAPGYVIWVALCREGLAQAEGLAIGS